MGNAGPPGRSLDSGKHGTEAGRRRRIARARLARRAHCLDHRSRGGSRNRARGCGPQQEMVSGWAVPVRGGSDTLAVLEFYSRHRLREDREAMAAVETAAASLGQMLARSQDAAAPRSSTASRRSCSTRWPTASAASTASDWSALPIRPRPGCWARVLHALTGKPVHELLHGAAPADRTCGEDCPLRAATAQPAGASGDENIFRADGTSFPAEYFAHAHPRPGPLFRLRAQLPRHQPALRPRPPEGRVHLHRQPRAAHPAHVHPRRARPALFRHSRRGQRQGRQPAAHRPHQLRPPGAPHQRHPRPRTHPERPRAARLPPRAVGRDRPPGHRRHAARGRCGRRAVDPRHHPGGDRRRPRPPAAGASPTCSPTPSSSLRPTRRSP